MYKLILLIGIFAFTFPIEVIGQNDSLFRIYDSDKHLLFKYSVKKDNITFNYFTLNSDSINLPVYFDKSNKYLTSLYCVTQIVDSLLTRMDSTTFLVSFYIDENYSISEYRVLYNDDIACLYAFKRKIKKVSLLEKLKEEQSFQRFGKHFVLIKEFTCFTNTLWSTFY